MLFRSKRHGTLQNGWKMLVEKIGINDAKEYMRKISNPSKAGKGNKGIEKSELHKRKISESLKRKARVAQ